MTTDTESRRTGNLERIRHMHALNVTIRDLDQSTRQPHLTPYSRSLAHKETFHEHTLYRQYEYSCFLFSVQLLESNFFFESEPINPTYKVSSDIDSLHDFATHSFLPNLRVFL